MEQVSKEHYCRIWQDLLESADIKYHIVKHLGDRKPLIERMLKYIAGRSGLKVLEVGCGTAIDSYSLASSVPGISICAMDYSQESLSLAKKIGAHFPSGIKLLLSDALSVAFKDEVFDIVFSQGLIEHFSDPTAIIREQMRVLKKDGLLIIDVPQKHNPYTLFKHRSISKGQWPWGWETEYSYSELKKLGNRLGLVPVDKCGHGHSIFFGLIYRRLFPHGISMSAYIANRAPLNKLKQFLDWLTFSLERRWGHLYMQSVAVTFRKREPLPLGNVEVCMISGSFHPLHCGIADYTFLLSRALIKKNTSLPRSATGNALTRGSA